MADEPAPEPAASNPGLSKGRKSRRDAKRRAQAQESAAVRLQSMWRGKQGRAEADEAREARAQAQPAAVVKQEQDAIPPKDVIVDVRDAPIPHVAEKNGSEPELRRRTPHERAEAYVLAIAEAAPPGARERLRSAAPCVASCWMGCALAGYYFAKGIGQLTRLLQSAPAKLLSFIWGILLCFFGGPFAVSFAAIEAFKAMGYRQLLAECAVLQKAWEQAEAADAADNRVDDDNDGTADVDALSPKQLLARKVAVLFASVDEPVRVQRACGCLFSAWLGALTVLKIKFARAVTLALGVARMLNPLLVRLFGLPLGRLLGPRHAQWAPVLLETLAQGVATCIAWALERGIAAWYSSMAGGFLAARSLMELGMQFGSSERAPAAVRSAAERLSGPDGTLADEVLGYCFFLAGFISQLVTGFELTFPLSVLLLPLLLIEWGLTWQLTWLT